MANVTILTPIVERNTTMPASFAAGSNRLLEYTVLLQSGASPVPPTSVTCNGITRTPFAGDTTTKSRLTMTHFLFFESELATIVNQAVTINGATASVTRSVVKLLQDAEQANPTNIAEAEINTAAGLSLSLTRSPNSLTALYLAVNNVNYTSILTNPVGTGLLQFGVMALTHGSQSDSAGTSASTATTTASARNKAIAINYKSAIQQSADINGGDPVQVGQQAIPTTLTGFTSIPTSVTCTYSSGTKSLTCSNISGNTSAITFDLEDRSEGVDYPYITENLEFTITNGSETTVIGTSIAEKTGETAQVFVSPIDFFNTYFAYHFAVDGFTSEGAEFTFTASGFTPPDFIMRDDSGFSSTSGGQVNGWFRPITGTGAGNVYYYEFTVTVGGSIVPTIRSTTYYFTNPDTFEGGIMTAPNTAHPFEALPFTATTF